MTSQLPEGVASVDDMTPDQARLAVIEALESDRFTQGRSRLTNVNPDDSELDCCLGVACKVYLELGGKLNVTMDHGRYRRYDGAPDILPRRVQNWLGTLGDPMLRIDDESDHTENATTLNDDGPGAHEERWDQPPWTFAQIAQAMRRTWGL